MLTQTWVHALTGLPVPHKEDAQGQAVSLHASRSQARGLLLSLEMFCGVSHSSPSSQVLRAIAAPHSSP